MSDSILKGKVALVTGAGSGLGEATAHAFARAGCNLVCIDIDGTAAERVRRDLSEQEKDIKCIALQCDVSNAEAVFKRVEAVEAHFGRLDIVVNCAAVDHTVSVNEMTIEQWDQVINVNLRGPFLLAKAAMPMMQRQHSGHIINIASTAATGPWANAAATMPPNGDWLASAGASVSRVALMAFVSQPLSPAACVHTSLIALPNKVFLCRMNKTCKTRPTWPRLLSLRRRYHPSRPSRK